jgi:DNA-directed RNA polymerase specialized sigma24 family protein
MIWSRKRCCALTHADQFTPGTNLVGWLSVILRNTYFTECRRDGTWSRSISWDGQERTSLAECRAYSLRGWLCNLFSTVLSTLQFCLTVSEQPALSEAKAHSVEQCTLATMPAT